MSLVLGNQWQYLQQQSPISSSSDYQPLAPDNPEQNIQALQRSICDQKNNNCICLMKWGRSRRMKGKQQRANYQKPKTRKTNLPTIDSNAKLTYVVATVLKFAPTMSAPFLHVSVSIMLTRYLKSAGGRDKFGKLSRYESIENRNFVSEACK